MITLPPSSEEATPKAITRETLRAGAGKPPEPPPPPKRSYLTTWTPSEFMDYQPPEDFVLMGDCHLTRGSLTVLGGWPGVGKSRAALGLAIAGARGVEWLGHRVHSRFRSLVIQCENGPFRLKQELRDAMPERGLDEWIKITPPPAYGLAFQEAAFRMELTELIAAFQPGLVIIDPWNRAADGDKQADYRSALDGIFECLPEAPEHKPAIMVIHHMRKKGSETIRKHGRDLLHELAGSYQIGAAARCVFALEPVNTDVTDDTVVLTCCKNNDGKEGAPSAWFRRNGLFDPALDFDMEAFLDGDGVNRRGTFEEIAKALRGMCGETQKSAAARLTAAGVCERSKAYQIIKSYPEHIVQDDKGKFWWREDGDG
ncbi:AAA family ATPase [Haloferula sp. BvORR071]|uniref:AAA family ATPase n=1 Tax=Haloferula sp. BvORR071 TaxID=1396141 RepID=UPI000550D69E|nr:AAA family ATPase [Haloferula sp. BvORR071]